VSAKDANGKNITGDVKVTSNSVNTAQAGIYRVNYSVTDANNNTVTGYQVVVVNDGSYTVDKDYIIYAQDFSINSKNVSSMESAKQILGQSYAKAWETRTGKEVPVTVKNGGGYSSSNARYKITVAVADKATVQRAVTATVWSDPVPPAPPVQPVQPQPAPPARPVAVAPVIIYQPVPAPAPEPELIPAPVELVPVETPPVEIAPKPAPAPVPAPVMADIVDEGGRVLGFLVVQQTWALVNLLAMIAAIILTLIQWAWLAGIGRRAKNEDSAKRPAGMVAIPVLAALIAVLAVIAFFLTEDLSQMMVMTDSNTWFMVLLILVQLLILGLAIVIGAKAKARKSSVIVDFGETQ
jgi:hypothetical protein